MASSESERTPIQEDEKFHDYSSHVIPWSVRLIWLFFWVFAVYYTIQYLFPALQVEYLKQQ